MKRKSLLIMLLVALFVPLAMNAQNGMPRKRLVQSTNLALERADGAISSMKGNAQNEMLRKGSLHSPEQVLNSTDWAIPSMQEMGDRATLTSTVTASRITASSATWTGSAGESWGVAITCNSSGLNQAVTNGYAQYGTQRTPATSGVFSTSGISGTITSVAVNCASYSGRGTVSVTVGGSAFGSSQSIPSWTNNAGGTRTFTGSASGEIKVTMTNASNGRAMYIKSITVTYEYDPDCVPPTGFAATNVTMTSATFSWTENGTSEEWAIVYMAEDDAEQSIEITEDNPFTLEGLNPATTYYAVVVPICGDYDQQSDMITFTTLEPTCPAPTDLFADDITNNSATLHWTSEVGSYNVQYRTAGGRELLFYDDFDDGDSDGWTRNDGGVYCFEDEEDNYFVLLGYTSTTQTQYLISPEFNISESDCVVAFYQTINGTATTYKVGYSSTTSTLSSFTWGSDITASNGWNLYYEAIPVGTKYIAIQTRGAAFLVDDFMVLGPYVEPGPWQYPNPSNVTDSYVTITGLDSETEYEWQVQAVCGGDDGESLWSSSTFTTLSACAAPTGLSSANITNNSASLSWTGYADAYNMQYREVDPNAPATLILNVPSDIWGDGTGYQLVLDADHNTYGTTIPESGNFTAGTFDDFEYTIPENAVCNASTNTIVVDGSASITIPAGVYDYVFLNPYPSNGTYYIASDQGFPSRGNDFEFVAGMTYEFTLSIVGQNDYITLTETGGSNWISVPGTVTSPYTLTGLDPETTYEWQVKGDGCTDWSASNTFTTSNNIPVESITASNFDMYVGDEVTISYTVNPSTATNQEVTFSSDAAAIATVDENGLVTGNAAGTAHITIAATDGSGVTKTITVTVSNVDVTGITATPTEITMMTGETATFSYTVAPDNATNKEVTITPADPTVATIATVDATTGEVTVTGVGVGTTTITIESVSNPGVKATVTVTVNSNPNAVQFTVNAPATAHSGDVITVEAVLTAPTSGNYGGFNGLTLGIDYDPEAFQFVAGSIVQGPVAQAALQLDENAMIQNYTNISASIRMAIIVPSEGVFVTDEGVVFSAQFTVLAETGEFTFTAQPNIAGNFNHEAELIPYEATPSTVEITVPVIGHYPKNIIGWDTYDNPDASGWYLIASPIGEVAPSDVTNMIANPEENYDLFSFDQTHEYEWINFKQTGNFTQLKPGKGYLYANKNTVTLTFSGYAYSGEGTFPLVYNTSNSNPDSFMRGWNLMGNPYAEAASVNRPYYTLNGDFEYVAAQEGQSVEMMEGVFVHLETSETDPTVTFTPASQSTDEGDKGSSLTLNITKGSKFVDRAIVSFSQGLTLPKFQFDRNHTKVYIPQDGQDYALVRSEEMGEMPVNFKAENNGTYSLNFSSKNTEFAYLHLIDNMTGKDIDLLQTQSYSFEARTTDYESRFKLVFATGDNSKDDNFAFFSNGSFIINNEGEATLQVIDVTGRILKSASINGCTNVNVNAASGIYMLRLVNGDNVKVQKVVVK